MAKDKFHLFMKEAPNEKSILTQFYNHILETAKNTPSLTKDIADKYPHYEALIQKTVGTLTDIISGKRKDAYFSINLTRHPFSGIDFNYHFTDEHGVYKCDFTYNVIRDKIISFTLNIYRLDMQSGTCAEPKCQTYIKYNINNGRYVFTLFENEVIVNSHLHLVFTKYIYLIKDMTLPFVDKL
jgi:hypothetical protein